MPSLDDNEYTTNNMSSSFFTLLLVRPDDLEIGLVVSKKSGTTQKFYGFQVPVGIFGPILNLSISPIFFKVHVRTDTTHQSKGARKKYSVATEIPNRRSPAPEASILPNF